MALIIATGSNLGDKTANLENAKLKLSEYFNLQHISDIYQSAAVGKEDQPGFYNQVLQFELPDMKPEACLEILLEIEQSMGRVRAEKWGPRIIDLDIIFWGKEIVNTPNLTIPHPYWKERSFVVKPMLELPYCKDFKNQYNLNLNFEIDAILI